MLTGMRRYWGIAAAWLAATALSVLIASAAVAGIRDRVAETPVALGAPTTSTTVAPLGISRSTTVPPSTTTVLEEATDTPLASTAAPAPDTTVAVSTTTTTAPPASTTTTTTTTTAPPPPTTTTTVAPTTQTYTLIGGSVTLSVGDGEVWVVSAVAAPGFRTEIEKAGPVEVKVEFESNDHKSELSAKLESGELKVEKEEEPREGDGD